MVDIVRKIKPATCPGCSPLGEAPASPRPECGLNVLVNGWMDGWIVHKIIEKIEFSLRHLNHVGNFSPNVFFFLNVIAVFISLFF